MKTFSIAGVIAINCFILVRYCWLIYHRKIQPALAMWLFFTIAASGSLLTYLYEGNYSLLDNIVNTADILLVLTVTIAILIYGDKSTKFNRFDTGCLVAVLLILVFWVLTRHHVIAHLCIQLILIIGYFPVVRRLWQSEKNTESYAAWIGLLLAPIVSLLSSKGDLATVYAIRAIVCTSTLLLLMIRADLKNNKKQKLESISVVSSS